MDRAIKGLAYEGKVSIVAAETTELVEYIRNLHGLTPTTTALAGRVATITGMMGLTDIKEKEDCITTQINGGGLAGSIVSVVRRNGGISLVKMYVQNPLVELPLKEHGKLDVGTAVGTNGYLNIIQKNDFTNTSYNGLVPLVSGEIAEDFTEYYAKSKQTPTVISLGVLVDKNGVKKSGGFMISLMPDATENEIAKIEHALKHTDSISKMLDDGISLEEIVRKATGDENALFLINDLSIQYLCDCSKEVFTDGLATLSKKDLEDIIKEDGEANTKCHFCNKEYHFSKAELEEILKRK